MVGESSRLCAWTFGILSQVPSAIVGTKVRLDSDPAGAAGSNRVTGGLDSGPWKTNQVMSRAL